MTIAGKSKFSVHVEKFQMPSHDRCGNICKICAIFFKKISFVKIYQLCCEIRFVVIYALLCGEKFIQKISMWRKMTNMRSELLYFLYFREDSLAPAYANRFLRTV